MSTERENQAIDLSQIKLDDVNDALENLRAAVPTVPLVFNSKDEPIAEVLEHDAVLANVDNHQFLPESIVVTKPIEESPLQPTRRGRRGRPRATQPVVDVVEAPQEVVPEPTPDLSADQPPVEDSAVKPLTAEELDRLLVLQRIRKAERDARNHQWRRR